MKRRSANTERLKAFSDGVFAVIITVLVLEFHVPKEASWHGLADLWPTMVSYAVSYWFIAIVWMNHHHVLQFTETATPKLVWANFAHLFSVSLLPFATEWVASTRLGAVPVCLYAAIFAFVNLTYIALCLEAMDAATGSELPPKTRGKMRMRSATTLAIFVAAAVTALWYPSVGFALILVCLLGYARPDVAPLS